MLSYDEYMKRNWTLKKVYEKHSKGGHAVDYVFTECDSDYATAVCFYDGVLLFVHECDSVAEAVAYVKERF